ncbi:VWA domain-containing protein [Nocardioides dongxiaopingii]|uniref:type II secretion system F family protein n=1 Tax=Nocardioides sp. S-1144 TaxID=2582905 RepID=UPI00110E2D66|nr:type II secretion system F family protein [Nocardioides sp. S-1144]QCW51225.1 VWA domain-containing protein [Nocardioides sp. S-1144]
MTFARRRRATVVGLLIGLAVLGGGSAVAADDDPVALVQRSESGIQIVVDVPRGVRPDFDAVTVTLAGTTYPVSEAGRIRPEAVQRTVVLAIDTSRSMRDDEKFERAKEAAIEFLDVVPADVEVGVVTFDSSVELVLPPTLDHDRAKDAVESLVDLERETLLYDAVLEATELTGADGLRSVLVLSDGENFVDPPTEGDTALADVVAAVAESEVTIDVVALDLAAEPDAVRALQEIAQASRGSVVAADPDSLRQRFVAEAADYQRQVQVTVEVPDDVLTRSSPGRITVPTSASTIEGAFDYFPIADDDPVTAPSASPDRGAGLPPWVLYLAIALVGAAVLAGFGGLAPAPSRSRTVEARIAGYTSGSGHRADRDQSDVPVLTQATEAIDGVLQHNRGFEERVAARLTSAGSALKASEWLLLHAGLVVGAILLGLLLGRANPAVVVLFALLGLVLPWFWLGLRRGRRRQKFESALPETLQLMAGSLSAGLSMLQAVDTIVREGTDPVASEFRRVLVEIRLGVPLDDALEGVAERFNSSDFRWVVMAIRIQRQVGGNLAELLTTVAGTIREREFIRRQVDALAAEGKLSAVVLGGLPPAFLLYLVVAQPSYVEPLFTDLRGLIMLVFSAVWLGIGIAWMSRLVKVEV